MDNNSNTQSKKEENSTTPVDTSMGTVVKEKNNNKNFPVKLFIKMFFIFVFLGCLGVGGYYGYKYVKRVDKDISSLKEQTKDTKILLSSTDELSRSNNDRVNTLASQVSSGASNYNYETPVFANFTVEKVLEDKNSALEEGFRFMVLDIKLYNSSQNDVYFSTGELKLKDSDNYEYGSYYQGQYSNEFVKKDTKVLFPDNRIPLSYTYIKPGETVKGPIVFVLNRPATKFTLMRNGVVLKDISL